MLAHVEALVAIAESEARVLELLASRVEALR